MEGEERRVSEEAGSPSVRGDEAVVCTAEERGLKQQPIAPRASQRAHANSERAH